MQVKNEFMKTGPMAERLGVSRRWLADQAERGNIPFAQIGTRTRLFKVADVDKWLEDHRIGGQR